MAREGELIMEQKKFVKFEGNCPRSVARDAKYAIKYQSGRHVVGIVYRTDDDERWYPVNKEHQELVNMVNEAKENFAGSPGGSFYINEYQQVIVPSVGERDYYLVGEYSKPLEFEFEGNILSGNALDMKGKSVLPGEKWVGPHPGIPYVLAAGGKDIYYDFEARPNVTKRVKLSKQRDPLTVQKVCNQINAIKGYSGGRFYINEFKQMFAPVNEGSFVDYVYIGKLDNLNDWFSRPHSQVIL